MLSAFYGGLYLFLAFVRYIVWPLILIGTLGPFGLIVWLFIH